MVRGECSLCEDEIFLSKPVHDCPFCGSGKHFVIHVLTQEEKEQIIEQLSED